MEKVKIGILGGGGILRAHAPGYMRLKDICKVAAIADPNTANHAQIRSLLGEEIQIYSHYQDLLNQADVDAVDIILPHDLHMPATIAAAKLKKPVLVEKVMARNIDECDQMIDACNQANVSLTVCHDRRYMPEWKALKDVVDSGELGEIFSWKLEHNQDVIFPEDAWVRTKDRLGGGAVMSCLTHQIDSLRWYAGEFESITCMTKTMKERMEGECVGIMAGHLTSGALAQLSINWWTQSNVPDTNGLWYELIHVCGTKGEAYYMTHKGTFVKVHGGKSKSFEYDANHSDNSFQQIKVDDGLTGHETCIREWVKSLRGEPSDILTPGTDSRKTVEVAEAAYLSEMEERTVKLPILRKPWMNTIK